MYSRRTLPSLFSGLMDDRPRLDQFVLLSILLHVLVIALFGDSGVSGGGARVQHLWGSLQVNMQRYLPERGAGPKLESGAASMRITTGRGAAPAERRQAERVDTVESAPSLAEAVAESTATRPDAPAIPEAGSSPVSATNARQAEVPPLLATEPTSARGDFVVPPPRPGPGPAPSAIRLPEMAPLPAVDATTSAKPARDFSTSLPALHAQDRLPPPLLEKITHPVAPREFAPPLPQPKLRELPFLPSLHAERVAPAKAEREFAPPRVDRAREPPAVPLALPKAQARSVDQEFLPAIAEPPRPALPVLAPTFPGRSTAGVEGEFAPPPAETKVGGPLSPAPAGKVTAEAVRQDFAPAPVEKTQQPAPAASREAPGAPEREPVSNPADARGSGETLPVDGLTRVPALPPAGDALSPHFDPEAIRSRARESARDGSGPRTLLSFPTLPKEPPKKSIEQAFDKALKRPDCKDAYAEMGLAAILPLVRDAIRDDGCKW